MVIELPNLEFLKILKFSTSVQYYQTFSIFENERLYDNYNETSNWVLKKADTTVQYVPLLYIYFLGVGLYHSSLGIKIIEIVRKDFVNCCLHVQGNECLTHISDR